MKGAYVLSLGLVPYREAWELQRSLAGAVSQGAIPDTIVLLQHPPVVTLGRRTDDGELHIPAGAEVDVVETDRGGKSTFHGPGQLVCYPIFDLRRHGQDVKRYCRELEDALITTLDRFGVTGERIDGLTGVWVHPSAAPGASLGTRLEVGGTTATRSTSTSIRPVHARITRAGSRTPLSRRSRASSAARDGRRGAPARARALARCSASSSRTCLRTRAASIWPNHEQLAAR